MIKAIVFDMDGIVCIESERFSQRFSRDNNIPIEDVMKFFERDFQSCLEGKAELKISLTKYLKKWKCDKDIDEILDYWFSNGNVNKEIISLVKCLKKQNIMCMLCTNNEKYRVDYIRKKFDFDSLFDSIITSFDVGAKKPDARIFDRILEIANVPAKYIIFCDDDEINIRAARNHKFNTIFFKNTQQLKEDIMDLGIQV